MVDEEVECRIREMLEQGYSYRQIREELGVGNWTITKVKKAMDREKRLMAILEEWEKFFRSREFRRVVKRARREEARLTWDKLEALFECWRWMELEYIERPLLEWRKLKIVERVVDLALSSMLLAWDVLFRLYWVFYDVMYSVLTTALPALSHCSSSLSWGIRGYPPGVLYRRPYLLGR